MNRMFYAIEEHDGKKYVHYEGFVCDGYEVTKTCNGTRFTDLTWLFIPVEKMASITCDEIGLLEEDVQQYDDDYSSDEEVEYIFNHYFTDENGVSSHGEHLYYRNVNESTPCGCYWSEGWWLEGEMED